MDTLLAIIIIIAIVVPLLVHGQIKRDADAKMKEIFGKDYKSK